MKTNTVASRFVLAGLTVPAMTFVIGCSHFEKEEAKKPEIALADQEVKVVADNRIPLTQKEFESLVESQIQAHPVWAISLEQYATEEIKKEIEKFKKEEKGQLMLQIQLLTQEKEQLKATRDKAVADKTAADKTIVDLQAQPKNPSAPAHKKVLNLRVSVSEPKKTLLEREAEKLYDEYIQICRQFNAAHDKKVALEEIHGVDSKEAKEAEAESNKLSKASDVAMKKWTIAKYKATNENVATTQIPHPGVSAELLVRDLFSDDVAVVSEAVTRLSGRLDVIPELLKVFATGDVSQKRRSLEAIRQIDGAHTYLSNVVGQPSMYEARIIGAARDILIKDFSTELKKVSQEKK